MATKVNRRRVLNAASAAANVGGPLLERKGLANEPSAQHVRPVQDNHSDIRRRRLLFRSWNRGTQESDLILGSFAETFLTSFDSSQLDRFEALLGCADTDLFDWMFGGSAPPPEHDHDVMRLLREFRVRRPCRRYQYGQFPTATITQE